MTSPAFPPAVIAKGLETEAKRLRVPAAQVLAMQARCAAHAGDTHAIDHFLHEANEAILLR